MMLKLKPTIGCRRLPLRAFALLQALLVMFAGATAGAQEGNRLQDIQVQSLSGQRIELKLIMTDTAPEPLAFTIENPARIALDLPGTSLGLSQRRRDVNQGPLDTTLRDQEGGQYGYRYAR
jgi:type IV pilus assembly protein PilQ